MGSFPDTQNALILAGLLRDVLLGAPCCLAEGAAEGCTLAVARVLGAAVCAAPEVVESMDAAGGGEGERLRGLLLSLSSLPDRRCLEELAPAWGRAPRTSPPPRVLCVIPLLQRQVLCVDTTASTPSTLR